MHFWWHGYHTYQLSIELRLYGPRWFYWFVSFVRRVWLERCYAATGQTKQTFNYCSFALELGISLLNWVKNCNLWIPTTSSTGACTYIPFSCFFLSIHSLSHCLLLSALLTLHLALTRSLVRSTNFNHRIYQSVEWHHTNVILSDKKELKRTLHRKYTYFFSRKDTHNMRGDSS